MFENQIPVTRQVRKTGGLIMRTNANSDVVAGEGNVSEPKIVLCILHFTDSVHMVYAK